MQRSAKIALVAVVAVVVLGSLSFWWFVLRSDAPERAALPTRDTVATSTTAAAPAGADGQWVVQASPDTFAGYRVDEQFAGEAITVTAVGRSPEVTGTMEVSGSSITAVSVAVDMTALASDSDRRDNAVRTQGIATDQYGEATFVLTEPIDIGRVQAVGEAVDVVATGDLTLRGVTRSVQVPLAARYNGDTIDVAGGTTVVLADFAIPVISNPFVTIADTGEFEMQLVFVRR